MNSQKPSFSISIDLELAWGVWDRINSKYLSNAIKLEREIVVKLLNIFNMHQIPVTWAIVAALIDPKNKMINIGDKKAWYAPDIIENIINSKINHLVASHSYAHPNFKETTENIIEEDFEKAEFYFKTIGISPNALVFPRNQVAHLSILKKFNYKFYRSIDKSWYKKIYKFNTFLGKIANINDKIFPFKTNSVKSIIHNNGLVEIPSSILLISRNGLKFAVTNLNMFYKIKKGIEMAIKNNECFHIWFHPSNFYFKSTKQFDLLIKILIFVNEKRNKGLIDIKLLDQH
jgi:peptidoglycan/xylan/chitin deacetylase (PgdA/CDA1 family)